MAAWCGLPPEVTPANQKKEGTMNSTVKVALLVVVIVACLGFVVFRLVGGKKGGGGPSGGPGGEKDLYCLDCKKAYKATVEDNVFMPLQMGGVNATPKHKCPTCGKDSGVAAVKCPSCTELVPSPGMQAMMSIMGPAGAKKGGATCPKCNKPLSMGPGGAGGSGGPGPGAK
jgi:hypothetical protein